MTMKLLQRSPRQWHIQPLNSATIALPCYNLIKDELYSFMVTHEETRAANVGERWPLLQADCRYLSLSNHLQII